MQNQEPEGSGHHPAAGASGEEPAGRSANPDEPSAQHPQEPVFLSARTPEGPVFLTARTPSVFASAQTPERPTYPSAETPERPAYLSAETPERPVPPVAHTTDSPGEAADGAEEESAGPGHDDIAPPAEGDDEDGGEAASGSDHEDGDGGEDAGQDGDGGEAASGSDHEDGDGGEVVAQVDAETEAQAPAHDAGDAGEEPSTEVLAASADQDDPGPASAGDAQAEDAAEAEPPASDARDADTEAAAPDGAGAEADGPEAAGAQADDTSVLESQVRRTSVKDRVAGAGEATEPVGAGGQETRDGEPPTVVGHAPVGAETREPGAVAQTSEPEPGTAQQPAQEEATHRLPYWPTGVPPASAAGTSGPDAGPGTRRRKGRMAKAGIVTGAIVLLLAVAYVGAAFFLADRVPGDTSVAGVDISGLSAPDAQAVLEEEFGPLEDEPLPVVFDDAGAELDPATAGLAFDAEATVDRFTGFTLDPRILLGHLFGLGDQEPVSHTDLATLEAVLSDLAEDLNTSPVEGSITLVDASAQVNEPEDGRAVDVEAASELIAEEWLVGDRPLELPGEVVEPVIGPDEIQTAMDSIVNPLLSGPVLVVADQTEVELTVEELSDAATLQTEDGDFTLTLDGTELAEVLTDKADAIGETPQDARIELDGGEPTVIPAVTGTGLDPAGLGEAVHAAALRTGEDERVAEVELTETEAEFTTEDAEALGVVERIGSYSTPMPHDPPRTENLRIGTSRINNTLIMPGEEFSLLEALSPITAANGYNHSGVVVDGFTSEAVGGGLSQLSTTVFNAAFEAGLEDVTHQPHSRWFERYPEGREATLYTPDLDMIFGNNTDYGVLIQSWVGDGQTHVVLWGTDVWDVEIVTSNRYNITQPQTVYNDGPNCIAESGGQTGFTVNVTRTVSAGGQVHEQTTYTHTYRPWNRVVCGSPSDDDD